MAQEIQSFLIWTISALAASFFLIWIVQYFVKSLIEKEKTKKELDTVSSTLKNILDSSTSVAIFSLDLKGFIDFWNVGAENLFGFKSEEIINNSIFKLLNDDQQRLKKMLSHITRDNEGENEEFLFNGKNGDQIWINLTMTPKCDSEGKIVGVLCIGEDYTRHKQAEEHIKASLREKEVLIREVHHRVKNNLQIVSSLLKLSINRAKNKKVINLLEDAHNRIYAIALIHSQLYKTEKFERIKLYDHLRELLNYISQIYEPEVRSIILRVKPSDIELSIDQAIPCSLVLNELITNSYKHAFKNRKEGEIEIVTKKLKGNQIRIVVKDNGIGFPEDLKLTQINSLGLKLVKGLVEEQLNGIFVIRKNKGTIAEIRFKLK